VDLERLWGAQLDFADSQTEEGRFKKMYPQMVTQFGVVFKGKMKKMLGTLKRHLKLDKDSCEEWKHLQSLVSSLEQILNEHESSSSSIKNMFTLKYAQENMIMLCDLLNKNLLKLEAKYQDHAQSITKILQNTIHQLDQITPEAQPLSLTQEPQFSNKKIPPKINNFLETSKTHPVQSLSNGVMYLSGDSLSMFKEGHLPSIRSILEFVLVPLRKSLSKYSQDFLLLQPLYQDLLLSQSVSGNKAWESLVDLDQRQQFLTRENLVIPLLNKDTKGVGSIAFICRSKMRECIEIYSPSDQENLHLKNSSFYFLRYVIVLLEVMILGNCLINSRKLIWE
jgi:hypothetical protein